MGGDSETASDRLLGQIPDAPDAGEEVDDGLLIAYREGRLTPAEAEAVEALLARSAEARALLAALAEPVELETRRRLEATIPAPRRALARRGLLGAAAALAAGIAALALLPRSGPGDPLPRYTLDAPQGWVRSVRSEAPEAPERLDAAGRLVLRLRPEAPTDARPSLLLFVVHEDRRLAPGPAGAVEAKDGAFRVSATGDALFGAAPGAKAVVLVLADSARLPSLAGRTVEEARAVVSPDRWWSLELEYLGRER